MLHWNGNVFFYGKTPAVYNIMYIYSVCMCMCTCVCVCVCVWVRDSLDWVSSGVLLHSHLASWLVGIIRIPRKLDVRIRSRYIILYSWPGSVGFAVPVNKVVSWQLAKLPRWKEQYIFSIIAVRNYSRRDIVCVTRFTTTIDFPTNIILCMLST